MKFIHLFGPQNSYKPSSIKKLIEMHGFNYKRIDTRISYQIRRNKNDIILAITSDGDTPTQVQYNLPWLAQRNANIAICVSRTQSGGYQAAANAVSTQGSGFFGWSYFPVDARNFASLPLT